MMQLESNSSSSLQPSLSIPSDTSLSRSKPIARIRKPAGYTPSKPTLSSSISSRSSATTLKPIPVPLSLLNGSSQSESSSTSYHLPLPPLPNPWSLALIQPEPSLTPNWTVSFPLLYLQSLQLFWGVDQVQSLIDPTLEFTTRYNAFEVYRQFMDAISFPPSPPLLGLSSDSSSLTSFSDPTLNASRSSTSCIKMKARKSKSPPRRLRFHLPLNPTSSMENIHPQEPELNLKNHSTDFTESILPSSEHCSIPILHSSVINSHRSLSSQVQANSVPWTSTTASLFIEPPFDSSSLPNPSNPLTSPPCSMNDPAIVTSTLTSLSTITTTTTATTTLTCSPFVNASSSSSTYGVSFFSTSSLFSFCTSWTKPSIPQIHPLHDSKTSLDSSSTPSEPFHIATPPTPALLPSKTKLGHPFSSLKDSVSASFSLSAHHWNRFKIQLKKLTKPLAPCLFPHT